MSEFEDEFRAVCKRRKCIKAEDVDWILIAIGDSWETHGAKACGLMVRKFHKSMSKEELKTIGLRGNTIISHKAYNALTERGCLNPIEAFEDSIGLTMRTIIKRHNDKRHQDLFDKTGFVMHGFTPRQKRKLP